MNPATNPLDPDESVSDDPGRGSGGNSAAARPQDRSRAFAFDPRGQRPSLTEQEKRILRLVCDGLTNAGIAGQLGLSPETVKSELKRMFHKIEVRNRTQAAVLSVRQRLL